MWSLHNNKVVDSSRKHHKYAPNIGEPKYIKQKLMGLKGVRDNNTKSVGIFNIQLSTMNRLLGQKKSIWKYWTWNVS